MAQDTLVLLCKNLNDAIMSVAKIERRYDLNRLYVFMGKRPAEKDLLWMSSADSSFCLERVMEWGENVELIGVRAGLMFATGWDLLFCWADNCPENKDIDWVRKQIKTDGIVKLSNVWGLSRDHYILHGLGEDVQQFSVVPKENNIITGLNIADALDGKPVDLNSALQALQEIISISPLAIHDSAVKDETTNAIINIADHIDNYAPVSMIIGEKCDENTILELKHKIANHGVLIQVCKLLPTYTFKPYRIIEINDGTKIALYGK